MLTKFLVIPKKKNSVIKEAIYKKEFFCVKFKKYRVKKRNNLNKKLIKYSSIYKKEFNH